MKEYLCSNFLAEQILNEVAPAHFQSRLGLAAIGTASKNKRIYLKKISYYLHVRVDRQFY